MKRVALGAWVGFACVAWAQQPGGTPGDVFSVTTGGGAEAPALAVQNLYTLAAQITYDPSSGYQQVRANESDWPAETAAQRQWSASMAAHGNDLSQAERSRLVPCAAHLNAAIDAMERGYRIEISQKGNAAAQKSAQGLYAKGRAEFALCRPSDVNQGSKGPAQLPAGAVATGDPDAPDAGAKGFVGSFPGTKNTWGSYCYTYLCENNIWNINPLPTNDPNSVGHSVPAVGDAAVVFRKLSGAQSWVPVHFAIYKGNGMFYQRNGTSSIEIVNSQFFSNYPNAIVRYINPSTGK